MPATSFFCSLFSESEHDDFDDNDEHDDDSDEERKEEVENNNQDGNCDINQRRQGNKKRIVFQYHAKIF